ncbi:hexameric tyrosine-coordinated heme protein [Histidinibacterium lentulum]|uniref:Peroxidase n=1 Tax=Histidinibacterium lentulum TaxID=2480588 RepID=A0A3N2R5R2_9RHOB|nr:hexameric tyrosine-coordinated heme protein [Histidinibacterium lentulum]ROU02825.1 hypothetical protein EAT49_05840 [Histidinibacterium lentulum]
MTPRFARTAVLAALLATPAVAQDDAGWLPSLITDTPEEGFQLAITLSRTGVTETQGNMDVLTTQREHYSREPDDLIAASQVIAIHFQTVAAANDYWR